MVICLLPSNTVLPKNEVIREWRLYPSLVFFALLAGHVFRAAAARAQRVTAALRYVPHVALAGWLVTFAHSDVLQNRAYATAIGAWRQVLAKYPYSADAMNNVGLYAYQDKQLDEARRYFEMAVAAAPDVSLFRHNLATAYAALGDAEAAQAQQAEAERVRATYGRRTMALHFRE
jgi:tetratricopeptide (TPR) repeat protein